MELRIDESSLSQLGFPNVQITLILRGNKDTTRKAIYGSEFIFPLELHHLVPMGNPPVMFTGYQFYKDQAYLSVFYTNNAAIHFASQTNQQHTHPIFFLEETIETMKKILDNLENTETLVFTIPSIKPIDYSLLKEMNGLDTLLYNLLIKQKIVIIGSTQHIITFIKELVSLIPSAYQSSFTYLINLCNQSSTLIGIDPEICEDYENKIETLLQNNYDIISLEQKQAYGEFTTPLTERIVNVPKEASQVVFVQDAIKQIFKVAKNPEQMTHIMLGDKQYELSASDKRFLKQVKEAWMQ